MVVTAYYADSTSATVTDYTVAPAGSLTTSTTSVTITYIENGITQTVTTPITVTAGVGGGGGGTDPAPTFTVTYNANGGINAPAAQSKTKGSAMTLSSKEPIREGYLFSGWANIPDGAVVYMPGDRYQSDANITLYAIWKQEDISQTAALDPEIDIYSFINCESYFPKGAWVNDKLFEIYVEKQRAMYSKEEAENQIKSFEALRRGKWDGSCQGFTQTVALNKLGYLDLPQNYFGSKDMYSAQATYDDTLSVINYYQHSTYALPTEMGDWNTTTREAKGLQKLIEAAKNNSLVSFSFESTKYKLSISHSGVLCHDVLICGYDDSIDDGYYNLIAYDNWFANTKKSYGPALNERVKIKKDYSEVKIVNANGTINVDFCQFGDDWNSDDQRALDVDGPNNDNTDLTSIVPRTEKAKLMVGADDCIVSANGKTATVQYGQVVSGNLDLKLEGVSVGSDEAIGEQMKFVYSLPAECTDVRVTSGSEKYEVTLISKAGFGKASVQGAGSVSISDKGIQIGGTDVTYSATLGLTAFDCNIMEASGEKGNNVSLRQDGDTVKISGVGENTGIHSYAGYQYYNTFTYDAPKDGNVVITDNASDHTGKIIISDSNGTVLKTVEHKCASFTDITNHWAHEGICYCIENGIMNGTADTTFDPNASMTRAMLVTTLYRMDGAAETDNALFSDVPANAYYANAVAWAAKNGIVTGFSETVFAPDEDIMREQMAAILYRYANSKGIELSASAVTATAFSDYVTVSDYAKPAMDWAVAGGLISGKSDNLLDPIGKATRAEVATILFRFSKAK